MLLDKKILMMTAVVMNAYQKNLKKEKNGKNLKKWDSKRKKKMKKNQKYIKKYLKKTRKRTVN